MAFINLYSQVELAKKKGIDRHRIPLESHAFIPVKVENAITRNNKNWYGVKYVDVAEVRGYLKNHRKPRVDVPKTNTYKRKKKATK